MSDQRKIQEFKAGFDNYNILANHRPSEHPLLLVLYMLTYSQSAFKMRKYKRWEKVSLCASTLCKELQRQGEGLAYMSSLSALDV
jgi:hypothetical protein